MKALKIIAAIIASILLLAAEGAALGLFSLDRALSEESVREAVVDSAVIDQLVEEALAENTVNMGGRYGEMMKAVFHTEPMTTFFTDYLIAAVDTQIYGKPYEEVANDELMLAFSRGIDKVNASGELTITEMEGDLLKQAMMAEVPDLTAKLNEQIGKYGAIDGEMAEELTEPNQAIQRLMGAGIRVGAVTLCLLLCAALAWLCWKSRLGFLWCGVVTAAVAGVYGALAFVGAEKILSLTASSASEEMVLSMLTDGFRAVAAAGFVAAAIFMVVFAVFKGIDRRKSK